MRDDSIRKRYMFSLLSQGGTLVLGMLTAGLVPRALGPAHYGNFQFLNTALTGLKSLFDGSVESAFFTWNSKNPRSTSALRLWLKWEVLQVIVFAVLVAVVLATGWHRILWPDQPAQLVIPIAVLAMITWYSGLLDRFADSKALTVPVKIARLVLSALQTILLVSLFLTAWLGLYSYVGLLIGVNTAMAIVTGTIVWRQRRRFLSSADEAEDPTQIYRYVKAYCTPLIIYSLVSWLSSFADRWILQVAAGSEEQGFYSLAYNWSQILLIFATAAISIYWREISAAHGTADIERVGYLYRRFTFLLFTFVCYFSTFISWHSSFIVEQIAGPDFIGAATPLALMAYYPIHQVYGQLSGILFMATDRTVSYSYLGYFTMALGFVGTYLIIAPRENMIPGLDLGAFGLGLRMVTLQFVAVNVSAWLNCRHLGISFGKMMGHQIVTMGLMFGLTFGSSAIGALLIKTSGLTSTAGAWLTFLLSGVLYSALVVVVVYRFPSLVGLEAAELRQMVRQGLDRVNPMARR